MKRVTVVFELTGAWEEWTVDVPADFDPKAIDFADMEFVCMEESGNTNMAVGMIYDDDGNELWANDGGKH